MTSNTLTTLPEESTTDLAGITFTDPTNPYYGSRIELEDRATLTLHGPGVVSEVQVGTSEFLTANDGSRIAFLGQAAAGGVIYDVFGGELDFYGQSYGEADYTVYAQNQGGTHAQGKVVFNERSSVGSSFFSVQAGSTGNLGGEVDLNDNANADLAYFSLFGNATIDLSGHRAPGVTIQQIDGNGGLIYLGSNNLTLDTLFSDYCSASLQDLGTAGGRGGSLTKSGAGNLVLKAPSTYTGGTKIIAGTLTVLSRNGSGTGTGPVWVRGGTLSGFGIIAGDVTIGSSAAGASTLALVGKSLGTMSIQGRLAFRSEGAAQFEISDAQQIAGAASAKGVRIDPAAQATFLDRLPAPVPNGTVITLLDNTALTPIAGAFANLPEGASLKEGPNTYRVTYRGGDGNDLTLTAE